MRRSANRKLFLFGRYSIALLPPKKWLNELGVEVGDKAVVELDKKRRRLIVSFKSDNPSSDQPAKTKPQSDDWEPIPKL